MIGYEFEIRMKLDGFVVYYTTLVPNPENEEYASLGWYRSRELAELAIRQFKESKNV